MLLTEKPNPFRVLYTCNKFTQYEYMIFKNEYNFQYVMVYTYNYDMNEFIHNIKIIKRSNKRGNICNWKINSHKFILKLRRSRFFTVRHFAVGQFAVGQFAARKNVS